MKPVYQTEQRERRYTVMKPVYQTSTQERRYTVMKPVYETTMVDQPYTVCRPVTTCRQEVEGMRLLRAPVHDGARPGRRAQVKVPVEDCGCEPRGLFSCLHKKKVTATVAVQCPPRTVSQRVFVSRPVVRNVSETRYVRETMVRQVPVQTCRMVAEERVESIPVTTCQMVAEERVEPYEVRTCQMVAEERVETIPVTTCQMVAEERVEPYEVRPARWSPRSASRSIPVTTCQMVAEERVEPYEVRTCQMVAEERVETIPVTTCQYVAEQRSRTRPRHDLPDGRRDRLAPGAGLRRRAGSRHGQSLRRPARPATDRRAAVHDGPGGRARLSVLQLTALDSRVGLLQPNPYASGNESPTCWIEILGGDLDSSRSPPIRLPYRSVLRDD